MYKHILFILQIFNIVLYQIYMELQMAKHDISIYGYVPYYCARLDLLSVSSHYLICVFSLIYADRINEV